MLGFAMEDIGLFKRGWKWFLSQKHIFLGTQTAFCYFRDKITGLVDHHWPMVSAGCVKLWKFLLLLLLLWKDCFVRGCRSLICLGPTTLFVVMWSCFLSLTSTTCLIYVLLVLGAAGAVVRYLGYTPGLFIAGLFGILLMWMFGNLWITGMLLIVGGYVFSLNHARLVILMSTIYAVYCVKVRVGWLGVFLSVNLAFFSNELFNYLLQVYDGSSEGTQFEEHKESEPIPEDFSGDCEYSSPASESENIFSCKSSSKTTSTTNVVNTQKSSVSKVVKADSSSINEMRRILDSLDHYDALGFSRNRSIDFSLLRKEYRRKAMLVHPDKNMGSPLASESFKKLQCAYEVLSDSTKKRSYDEQLRKEESKRVCQRSCGTPQQAGVDHRSEESRCIRCTKCGNSHLWICTNRTKAKARWCQCFLYHPAKDGDGWVEKMPQKVEIPCAFVCAESKIFDVSEWASCQGVKTKTPAPPLERPPLELRTNLCSLRTTMDQKDDAWDLLYAAAGQVMRMKMNEQGLESHGQGLLGQPRKPVPVPVSTHMKTPNSSYYSDDAFAHFQLQHNQFQILRRQQFMRQQLQNRSRASGFGHGRCGRSSSSFCANPPHHHHQQQQGGSGMRAIFLEGSGSKRESVGTGVFLPRRVGSSTELRRKPACSTVLVPARVVQALNLNLDEMGSAQPRFQGASMTPRSNSNALLSQQMLCIQPHRPSTTTNYEVRLPQEWTY